MALNATSFMGLFRNYRMMYLSGRYGGGKTASSVRFAYDMLDHGWVKHALGNFPCVLFEDPNRITDMEDTVLVLDEAGVWLSDKEFDKLTAFLRKKNLYLIMATVLPPPLRAKVLVAQRTRNLQAMGVPMWMYSGALVQGVIKEKADFTWWQPSEVFGLYDTSYVTDDDCGLLEWVKDGFQRDKEYRHAKGWFRYTKEQHNSAVSDGTWLGDLDEGRGTAWAFQEAAETIASSVSVSRRKSRR